MTNFIFLSRYSGNYSFKDSKNEQISGTAYYLIVVKDDCCKPAVYKCSDSIYKQAETLEPYTKINMLFEERGTVSGMNTVK